MRFRVRDILLAVALAATFLAACKYVLNSAEGDAFNQLPMNPITVSIVSWPFFFACFLVYLRKLAIRKAQPIVCEFCPTSSWHSYFVVLAMFWAYALATSPVNGHFKALLFVYVSVGIIVSSLLPTLFGSVKVGQRGIVYQASFVPWSKIQFDRGDDDTIVQLKSGKLCLGVAVDVPQWLQDQIQELCEKHRDQTQYEA